MIYNYTSKIAGPTVYSGVLSGEDIKKYNTIIYDGNELWVELDSINGVSCLDYEESKNVFYGSTSMQDYTFYRETKELKKKYELNVSRQDLNNQCSMLVENASLKKLNKILDFIESIEKEK